MDRMIVWSAVGVPVGALAGLITGLVLALITPAARAVPFSAFTWAAGGLLMGMAEGGGLGALLGLLTSWFGASASAEQTGGPAEQAAEQS